MMSSYSIFFTPAKSTRLQCGHMQLIAFINSSTWLFQKKVQLTTLQLMCCKRSLQLMSYCHRPGDWNNQIELSIVANAGDESLVACFAFHVALAWPHVNVTDTPSSLYGICTITPRHPHRHKRTQYIRGMVIIVGTLNVELEPDDSSNVAVG